MKFLVTLLIPLLASCESSGEQARPVELGKVNWSRTLAGAFKQAQKSKKPILLLFQEVPG